MRKRPVELDMWGMAPDLPPEELPADKWASVFNVIFRTGAAERVGGVREYAVGNKPVGLAPLYVQGVRTPTDAYLLVVSADAVHVTNGSNWWDITPTAFGSFTPDGLWTGCELNGIPCINHPGRTPLYWDRVTTNVMQELPGWPANTTCKVLSASKYHLFALNVTQSSQVQDMRLLWSDAADPGSIPQSWTPAADNEAGDNILAATKGEITAARPLRDQLIIYKRNSCYMANYIGGQLVWSFRKLFSEDGAASVNCVAEHEGTHIVLTASDVKQHDGQSIRSIAEGEIRQRLFQLLDQGQANLAQVIKRPGRDEIWVAIPVVNEGAGLRWAAIWNPRQPGWGSRELKGEVFIGQGLRGNEGQDDTYDGPFATGAIYDEQTRVYDVVNYSASLEDLFLADHDNGRVALVDGGDTYHGEPIAYEMRREGLKLSTNRRVFANELWPDLSGPTGQQITIRCGAHSIYGEAVTYCPPRSFRIGQQEKTDFQAEGRYLALQYSGSGGGTWRLDGQRIRVSDGGRF